MPYTVTTTSNLKDKRWDLMTDSERFALAVAVFSYHHDIEVDEGRQTIRLVAYHPEPKINFQTVSDVTFKRVNPADAPHFADAKVESAWLVALDRPCTQEELDKLNYCKDFYEQVEKWILKNAF